MPRIGKFLLTAIALSVVAAQPTNAQGLGGRLKAKIKQRVDQRTDQAMDRAIDKGEGAIKCVATDQECIRKAKAEGKGVVVTDPSGKAVSSSDSANAVNAATAAKPELNKEAGSGSAAAPAGGVAAGPASAAAAAPGTGTWVNYDFVPGDRPIFVEDFTKDNVGDFPRRLELKDGNLEVVEWNGGRWLRATSFGTIFIPLPEVLPERFTMEFDFAGPAGWNASVEFDGNDYTNDGTYVSFNPISGGIDGKVRSMSEPSHDLRKKAFPVRIMADGKYVKVYMDDKRVGNAPNAEVGRAKRIMIRFGASEEEPAFFANFRIAAGGKKLYDALAATGRVATQGIFFDTGSDRIRPESTPTLKEIGTMLKEHADLKLTIEGHTDNVGDAASNQTLSEKRAAAVKAYLVSSYGIDAGRLQTKGLGASKPAASNDTPEGRQQNRRVELVKM
jgi:OmpA-OmpF porin, OOP family